MTRNIKDNKYLKLKKYLIIVISVLLFSLIAIFFNFVLSKEKYEVNLNLSFDLKTKISWNDISKRYENIINMYDTKEKEKDLVDATLHNYNNINLNEVIDNLRIESDVYARQTNIEYIAQKKEEGLKIVNAIGDTIISKDENFMPKEKVKIEKKFEVETDSIKLNKKLNVLTFAILGLAIGIGLSIIMEEKWLSKRK